MYIYSTFIMVKISFFYLRPSDELFQQLDDNQVTLSTMKASRFVKAFEEDVDHWERTLSLILEVIEMILQVQRQWMYLEVRKMYMYMYNNNVLYGDALSLEYFYWRRHQEAATKGIS